MYLRGKISKLFFQITALLNRIPFNGASFFFFYLVCKRLSTITTLSYDIPVTSPGVVHTVCTFRLRSEFENRSCRFPCVMSEWRVHVAEIRRPDGIGGGRVEHADFLSVKNVNRRVRVCACVHDGRRVLGKRNIFFSLFADRVTFLVRKVKLFFRIDILNLKLRWLRLTFLYTRRGGVPVTRTFVIVRLFLRYDNAHFHTSFIYMGEGFVELL